MFVTLVSKRFIPWDGPRPKIMEGLLPVGFAKSPTVVDVGSERWMNCRDPF